MGWTEGDIREGRGACTVGDQHGLAWPLACDVVDLAAMRGLKVTGQEADGSSEGGGVLQEGRDIPGNKERLVAGERGAETPQDPRDCPCACAGSPGTGLQRLAGS